MRPRGASGHRHHVALHDMRHLDEPAQLFVDFPGGAVVDHQRRPQHPERQRRGARRVHLADAAVDHLDALGGALRVEFVVDRGENKDFSGHAK